MRTKVRAATAIGLRSTPAGGRRDSTAAGPGGAMAFYRESLISRFAAGHASLHLDGLGNALQILGDVLAAQCVIVADEDNLARPRRSGDRGIVREGSVHGVVSRGCPVAIGWQLCSFILPSPLLSV